MKNIEDKIFRKQVWNYITKLYNEFSENFEFDRDKHSIVSIKFNNDILHLEDTMISGYHNHFSCNIEGHYSWNNDFTINPKNNDIEPNRKKHFYKICKEYEKYLK